MMSAPDYTDEKPRSPYARVGWIAAAVVIIALVTAFVFVMVTSGGDSEPGTSPSAAETLQPSPSPEVTPGDESASTCGIAAVKMDGTVSRAPETAWLYVGTTSFPGSSEFGPLDQVPQSDIYTCFARTPEGAVLAASTAMAYMMSPEKAQAWREYALAPGPVRDKLLGEPPTPATGLADYRVQISGFRLLSYDGNEAKVDVGVMVQGNGKTIYMSSAVPLVWMDGDWKANFSLDDLNISPANLRDLAGYVMWK